MTVAVKKLVARDTEVKETLTDAPEAVQEVLQSRPNPFHCVIVDTNSIGVVTGVFACSMIDGAMFIPGLGVKVVDVVLVGEELTPPSLRR